jgi:hypothetical protein
MLKASTALLQKFAIAIISLFLIIPRFQNVEYGVILLLIIFCLKFKIFWVPKPSRLFFILNIIAIIFTILSTLLHGELSVLYFLKPIRIIVVLYLLVNILNTYNITRSDVFTIIISVALINGIFVYFQYFAGILGYTEYMNYGSAINIEKASLYRKTGLMTGYPTAGILSLFGLISIFYLQPKQKTVLKAVLVLFLLGATFLTSRTGLYLAIIIIPFYLLKHKTITYSIIGLILFTTTFFFNIVAQDVIIYDKIKTSSVLMFEVFTNYEKSGTISTRSTNSLLKYHYFSPQNIFNLIFGNNETQYSHSFSTKISDVFYVRILNGAGIVILILYLLMFSQMFIYAGRALNKWCNLFSLTIYIIVGVTSFKGSYIFAKTIGDISLLVFASDLIVLSKKHENYISN